MVGKIQQPDELHELFWNLPTEQYLGSTYCKAPDCQEQS